VILPKKLKPLLVGLSHDGQAVVQGYRSRARVKFYSPCSWTKDFPQDLPWHFLVRAGDVEHRPVDPPLRPSAPISGGEPPAVLGISVPRWIDPPHQRCRHLTGGRARLTSTRRGSQLPS
jgi:hypothetical protein